MTNGMRLVVAAEPYSSPFYQRTAECGNLREGEVRSSSEA